MKKIIPAVILMIPVMFTSCVRSLYPVTENENEMVFKKELLGHWTDRDSAQFIVDTVKGSGKMYRVTIVDSDKEAEAHGFSDTSYFLVRLAYIRNRYLLDCTIDMDAFANKKIGGSAAGAILQTHYIIPVISFQQNAIEAAPIDEGKLRELLTQKKVSLRNELTDEDNLLITEKPLALQQKLRELEKFPVVFGNSTLTRAKN